MDAMTLDHPLPKLGTMLVYFGPATVRVVLDRDLEVETPAGELYWGRSALPSAYRPQDGDVVLAMATVDECYVVGVLDGRGPTVLHAPGDLELRAPNGRIHISGAEGCVLTGPTVQVDATEIYFRGETLQQDFETVRNRISGLLDTRAKSVCSMVAETYRLAASRIVGRGKETVTIEAPSINLG